MLRSEMNVLRKTINNDYFKGKKIICASETVAKKNARYIFTTVIEEEDGHITIDVKDVLAFGGDNYVMRCTKTEEFEIINGVAPNTLINLAKSDWEYIPPIKKDGETDEEESTLEEDEAEENAKNHK